MLFCKTFPVLIYSVQSFSRVRLLVTPGTAACQASLSVTNSRSLPKLMSIESVMPSIHLILCHPLLLPSSILPSIRVFSNESVLPIRWPKYWSLSFSISPSNEYLGLISFRIDWLDLLAVQGDNILWFYKFVKEREISLGQKLEKHPMGNRFWKTKIGRIFLCDVRCERQFRQRVNLNKDGHGDGAPDVWNTLSQQPHL